MIYLEHQAKAVLAEAGMPVPDGKVLAPDEPPSAPGSGPWYVKAQVDAGGRGKQGLVRRAEDGASLREAHAALRAADPQAPQLVELAVPAVAERYLAIGLDTAQGTPFVVVGADGGVDIEYSDPARRARSDVSMARGLTAEDGVRLAADAGLAEDEAAAVGPLLLALWRLFRGREGELLEINPMIWDGRGYVLADAKLRTYEREAEGGTVFYARPGTVAVLSGGAGLGMAMADMLCHLGAPPANFSDVVGGVTKERLHRVGRQVLQRCRDDEVKALLIALSVSLTPLAVVVESMRDLVREVGLPVPAVAYFGSGAAQSRTEETLAELASLGVEFAPDLETSLLRAAGLGRGER